MDVRCEKCQTEYSLDETLVSPSGTAVRCTTCNHVFKAFPPGAAGSGPANWMLQQAGGATFPFERMGVLQDWIATGKVAANDQISRDGVQWKRLGDMIEMRPFFDAAASARAAAPGTAPVAAGYGGARPSGEHMPTVRTKAIVDHAAKGVGVRPVTAPFVRSVVQGRKTEPPPPMARVQQPQQQVHATNDDTMMALDKTMSPTGDQQAAPANGSEDPGPVASTSPTSNFQLDQTMRAPSAAAVASAPTSHMSQAAAGVPGQPSNAPHQVSPDVAMSHAFEQQRTMPAGGKPAQPSPASVPVNVVSSSETRRGIPLHDPDMSQVPAGASESWNSGESLQTEEPAWAGGDRMDMAVEDEFAEDMPPRRRHVGRWVSLFIVVLLLGGGFYMYMFQRDTVDSILGSALNSSDDERFMGFYLKGQESFLLDTETAFTQADREYHQVLGVKADHAATMAALGELYAVWAQRYVDQEIDARVDAIAKSTEESKPDFAEADRLAVEFDDKLAEARRWSEQALKIDPEMAQGHLAMADVQRLSGDMAGATASLKKGRSTETLVAANYLAAMLAMSEQKDTGEIIGMLKSAAGAEPLVRALYREARLRAADGNTSEARGVLARVRALNSDHDGAAVLTQRLDDGLTVALVMPDSGGDASDVDAGPTDEEGQPQEALATGKETGAQGGGKFAGGGGGGFAGGSVESMLVRATKLQRSGNAAAAKDLFEEVLDKQPGNLDALSGLGYCHLGRRSFGPAIAAFRRALGVSPSYGPATIGLADAFRKQGQKEQALKYYEKYVSGHSSGGDAYRAGRAVDELKAELAAAATPDEKPGSGGDIAPVPYPEGVGTEAPGGGSAPEEKPAAGPAPSEPTPYDEKPADDKSAAEPTPYAPSEPSPQPAPAAE